MIYLIPVLLLGEGIIMGIVAGVMFRRKKAKLRRCRRTRGEVVEVKEHRGSEGSARHPVIRFPDEHGESVTFESKYGRSNWNVTPGDPLELWFDPAAPTDAELVGFMPQWGLVAILAATSAGSIIGALVAFLLFRHF